MINKTFKQYLSETKFMEELDYSKPFKVLVDAPTSGGKSYYVVNYLKDNDIPFVFLSDTLLLMTQLGNDYGVDMYSAANKSSLFSDKVISVYNHIEKFWRGKVIVIDEAHSLIADYSYKRKVIEDLITFAGEAEQVIMLSGTPLVSEDIFFKDVEVIKCVKEQPKEYTILTSEYTDKDDKYKQMITLALYMKSKGKIPVISLLDTKGVLNTVVDLLKSNGFNNIGMINSMVKDDTDELDLDTTHYKELTGKGLISNADAIITTYVQGYNINNTNCGLIFLPSGNKHSYVSIAQMVARFRKIDDLEIFLLKKTPEQPVKPWLNYDSMKDTIKRTERNEALAYIAKVKQEYKTERMIRKYLAIDNEISYMIDADLNINNQLLELSVLNKMSNLLYTNTITANTILNKYNITVKEINLSTNKIEANMNITGLDSIDYKAAVIRFFSRLKVGEIPQDTMNLAVKAEYDKFLQYELTDSKIESILLEVFGNKRALNKSLMAYNFRLSTEFHAVKIRQDIYRTFKVNKWYSSTEIFSTVKAIVEDNKGKCNSSNKASEILNFLFETESEIKRFDSKLTRGLTIKSTK